MTQVVFTSDAIDKVRDIADSIKSGVQNASGHFTETDSHSAYNAHLPEGVTPAVVKEVASYNSRFIKAAHVAVGELAGTQFAGDKHAQRVTARVGYFAPTDNLDFTAERQRSYPNPQAKDGEDARVTKSLVLTMTEDVRGHTVKSLRDTMSEQFAQKFC
ncbi:hypothetical protein [Flavobacterium sp.]|jgi:hypothetical protein|uniref:hypothetical protein n=1 Tax=Flavobacterium sp. TaxID=239 RepID=UPI0037BFFDDD